MGETPNCPVCDRELLRDDDAGVWYCASMDGTVLRDGAHVEAHPGVAEVGGAGLDASS